MGQNEKDQLDRIRALGRRAVDATARANENADQEGIGGTAWTARAEADAPDRAKEIWEDTDDEEYVFILDDVDVDGAFYADRSETTMVGQRPIWTGRPTTSTYEHPDRVGLQRNANAATEWAEALRQLDSRAPTIEADRLQANEHAYHARRLAVWRTRKAPTAKIITQSNQHARAVHELLIDARLELARRRSVLGPKFA